MSQQRRLWLRLAADIRERMLAYHKRRRQLVEQQLALLADDMARLETFRRKLNICERRNWELAANKLMVMGESVLNDVPHHVAGAREAFASRRTRVPSVREVYESLLQTDDEFGGLEYRRERKLLVVATEPIELEDVYLGPFEIQLHIPSLTDMRYSTMYYVVALEPRPAASNEGVTHPHVTDEQLCAGDAAAAIHTALAGGRICDFFTLVKAVLGTYNPDSPYVSLEKWFGVSCYDCGSVVDDDETLWCRVCEHDYCPDCASYCNKCDETTCLACLKACAACEESICLNCIETCPVCEEPVCHSCLTTCPDCERRLCTVCLEDEQCPCVEEGENEDGQDDDRADGKAEPIEQEAAVAQTQPA